MPLLNRAQWIVLLFAAAVVVLAWPPDRGHGISLGARIVHRLIDPTNHLPALPPPLPPGLGDDGEAVAAHDELEAEYYRLYNSSSWTRWRMELKAEGDPLDPTTTRQGLVAVAVAAGLLVWKLSSATSSA